MLAVVLPGRAYDATMPALAVVIDVLERQGYDVCAVSWTLTEMPADPAAWVTERLVAAAADGCDVLEIDGADHALTGAGGEQRGDAILAQVADATATFVRRLA